jgi:hypothetical protein
VTAEQLEIVADGLASVSGAFKEFRRQWHPSNGGNPPFAFLDECLEREASRFRGAGQYKLVEAFEALRSDLQGMDK